MPTVDNSEDIDSEAVLKAIEAQHGIFVERSKGYYSFSHLTFQEYFTARYIVEHIHEGTLQRLIHSHFLNDNWREVFLLTAEMLDDAGAFFEIFLAKLDEMVMEDERLIQLLTTIEQDAASWQTEGTRFESQCVILLLMLDTAHTIAHTIALDSARALVLVSVREIANAKELSKQQGFTDLYNALNAISVPSENDAPETWSAFSHVLFDVFQTHFSLEDYEYTVEQAMHVLHYLEATTLLLDCLENAYVSDREAILERLLRVPAAERA